MTDTKEVIGYYAEDGNICCVECINKNIGLLKAIDRAITGEGSEENLYVCDGCKAEIKYIKNLIGGGKAL